MDFENVLVLMIFIVVGSSSASSVFAGCGASGILNSKPDPIESLSHFLVLRDPLGALTKLKYNPELEKRQADFNSRFAQAKKKFIDLPLTQKKALGTDSRQKTEQSAKLLGLTAAEYLEFDREARELDRLQSLPIDHEALEREGHESLASSQNVKVLRPEETQLPPASAEQKTVVFFAMDSCAGCQELLPTFVGLARYFPRVTFYYTRSPVLANLAGVQSFPMLSRQSPEGSWTHQDIWQLTNTVDFFDVLFGLTQ